jgi:hypothetical protein
MNEDQKAFDLTLKLLIYGIAAIYFLNLLEVLPNDIADKVVNLLLGKVGL